MELILATGNPHKKEELSRILASHRILIPSDISVDFDADETGTTYLENALIKASVLFEASGGRPVIADDSGISVPSLDGAPGVFSARYGSTENGIDLEASERNELLLKNMSQMIGDDRKAFFVCCMVLILDDYRVFTAQETFSGIISEHASGIGGFGYDPIFMLPQAGCTVAELEDVEKDRISHRGRAGKRIKAILDNLDAAP